MYTLEFDQVTKSYGHDVVVGVLAAGLPALRAARLNILQPIATS